jgi:hypothetical protein
MEEEFFFEKLTVYQESRALVKATPNNDQLTILILRR